MVGAACSSDAATDEASSDTAAPAEQNACPAAGCVVTITEVATSGSELVVTMDANFNPDISKNHIHIYWDNFEPEQVSNDAADRGVEQGEWVPTDAAPQFTTEGVVSTSVAGESTTLCVTVGDRDHNVIDADAEYCMDVADVMS